MNTLLSFNLTFRQIFLFSSVVMMAFHVAIAPASASDTGTADRDGLPNKTVPAGTY